MKKTLFSATAAALIAGPAIAADLPARVAPYRPLPPVVYNWTGCNVSAGVGYGMYNQAHYSENIPALTPLSGTSNSGGEGWLGRFGAGCDYQIDSRWVVGLLADYDVMDVHGVFQNTWSGFGGEEKESRAWGVGGRIGYLATPSLLTFLSVGYTQAHFNQVLLGNIRTSPPLAPNFFMPAATYSGWFLGSGAEYHLEWFSGLFWRTEYRYATYRSHDLAEFVLATGAPTGTGDHLQKHVQTVTSSLVWRFNFGGAPLATRY